MIQEQCFPMSTAADADGERESLDIEENQSREDTLFYFKVRY